MSHQALVVEDEPTLATIFSKALEEAGFTTKITLDARSARAWLRHHAPLLVVLDLHLPDLSGERLLEEIRTDARLAETRVIIASADATLAGFLKEQADLVLEKPVSFHQLRQLAARFRPE